MPLSSVKLKEDDRVNVEPTTVAGISAFLGKLWKMVEDPKTDELISWGKSGNTFVIKNQINFAKTILPNYYKHNNIASFIRQLNMYGFHKIISTTSGALDSTDNDEIEFTHPCFVRGHPYLLEQIKRKMNNPKENLAKSESGNQFNESIKRVFNDIKNLKGKQEYLGSQLSSVKQENEILWRELSLLRQKHAAQQNVLNKLIRFLVSLAQPSNHGIVKRRLIPLMLKDSSSSSSTVRTKQEPIIQDGDHLYTIKKRRETSSPGPTIHEIHPSEMMDNVQIIETPDMEVGTGSPAMIDSEMVSSPASILSNSNSNISSPNPVPTALYPSSSRKGKSRQFLISQPMMVSGRHSPEYVIPESTDNPLLELVQETVADDDDDETDFITVVNTDGAEMVAQNSPEPVIIEKSKKRNTRKNVEKDAPVQFKVLKTMAPKPKMDTKRKPAAVNVEKDESNDFLVDLSSYNEPMVEIHTPSTSGISPQPTTSTAATAESLTSTSTNPDEFLQNKININVEDIINIPPDTTNLDDLGLTIGSVTHIRTPLIHNDEINADGNDDVVFELHEDNVKPFVQKSESGANENMKSDNEALINRITSCIDNAQNMRLACTDNSIPSSKTLADLSMHLDSTQTDLNQLKEMIQNEGLVLDANTLNQLMAIYTEDPMDYNMPPESSVALSKANNEFLGNELISAPTIFDFNDIFNQSDWSQPNTPLNTADNDYCDLNTPQIESSPTDESQLLHPPASKKIKSK